MHRRQLTVEIVCDESAQEPRFSMNPSSGPDEAMRVESVHGCPKRPEPPPPPVPWTNCTWTSPAGSFYDYNDLVTFAPKDWSVINGPSARACLRAFFVLRALGGAGAHARVLVSALGGG